MGGAFLALSVMYCVLHQWALNQQIDVSLSLSWAIAAMLPFYIAFETGKRTIQWGWNIFTGTSFAVLVGAFLSIAIGQIIFRDLWEQSIVKIAFDLILPSAATLVLLRFTRRFQAQRQYGTVPDDVHDRPDFDLSLEGVDLVRTAGNYVELVGQGKSQLVRATMISLEKKLQQRGFVRIHRGAMAMRDQIDRIQKNNGHYRVVMKSGECQRASKSYRRNLGL